MHSDHDPVDLGAVFLGPKAENAELFERLLLEALRDHVFWRRNFHPRDGVTIQEQDKRTPAFEHAVGTLSQELMGLLAELKAGVPFFSPRYIGHMTADLTMAGLVGYFATMLYNPNNVAAEGSPVTTRLELEVAAQLAAMIGYDASRQWGHLASGGTVANIEALWVARNVKYLTVALRWAAAELGDDLPGGELSLRLPGGSAPVGALDLWELLNVDGDAVLDGLDALLRPEAGDPDARWAEHAWRVVRRNSLAALGFQEFGLRLAREFGDALPPGVVLVPSTAHYSWSKSCRVLGIGDAQLVHVPVDDHFRMSPDALDEALRARAARRQPVIAAVSVIGATEESAVDRLDLLLDVRRAAAGELGMTFHLHADAAWGGYATCITRDARGARRTHADAVAEYTARGGEPGGDLPEWPSEGLYRALCALEHTDSVTIDPHKMGFVPYPAGAVSFRDRRVRHLVSVDAPYLFHRGASEWGFIGRYILEGSKPGAAAAAVWLSHSVLPLDARGYGRLIADTVRSARALYDHLATADWEPFRLVLLPPPDLNIVCFAVTHPAFGTLEEANAFVSRVYRAMSAGEERDGGAPDYFITKTVLQRSEYGAAAEPIVERLGFTADDYGRTGGLGVLRCTVMDPFMATRTGRVDHVRGFAKALRVVLEREFRMEPVSVPE